MAMQWGWVFFRELFAIFRCAVSKYLSIQEEVRLMGKFAWLSCLLPPRCIPVGLGFKGEEMAMWWGPEASNGDTQGVKCKVQVCSLGCFEQTKGSEAHGNVGLDILFTAYKVYLLLVWLRATKWRCIQWGTVASNGDSLEKLSYSQSLGVQPAYMRWRQAQVFYLLHTRCIIVRLGFNVGLRKIQHPHYWLPGPIIF